jgi:hypothetical protein
MCGNAIAVNAFVVQASVLFFVAIAAEFAGWTFAYVAVEHTVTRGTVGALCAQAIVDCLFAILARKCHRTHACVFAGREANARATVLARLVGAHVRLQFAVFALEAFLATAYKS